MATHNKTVDKGSTARGKGVNLWPTYTLEPPTDISEGCAFIPKN